MSIVTTFTAAYRKAADHIGKIIATAGAALMTLDITGQGDSLKQMANTYLGVKGAQKVGVVLFALAGARFLYAGWKAGQHKAQIEALQAQVDELTKQHQADAVAQGHVVPIQRSA